MANRSIFNRQYSSYQPGSTQVWLVNGAGTQTSPVRTLDFTAGANLVQGETVYVSGSSVYPALAASGASLIEWQAIGITLDSANASESVEVTLDDTAIISSANLIHQTSLTPGEYYYISTVAGKLAPETSPSGITGSGGYAAQAPIGVAVSTSELSVEIAAPITLYP